MTRDEIALRLLCALLARSESKVDLYPELGEPQIRTCFMLADNFRRVAHETTQNPPPPQVDIGGLAKKGI